MLGSLLASNSIAATFQRESSDSGASSGSAENSDRKQADWESCRHHISLLPHLGDIILFFHKLQELPQVDSIGSTLIQ